MTPMEIEALVNGTNAYGSIIGGRWPNGIVPYVIDRSIGKENEFIAEIILSSLENITDIYFLLMYSAFYLKIRNFAGSRSKNCEIYRVFFHDRIIYCEFRGVCLRNGQFERS